MAVNRAVRLWLVDDPNEIIRCKSPQQKPFMRLGLDDGTYVELSFATAEWIGDCAVSARIRYEFEESPSRPARKNRPRVKHEER